MQHRRWISALQLNNWAESRDAQSRLPELVRRLAHATVEAHEFKHIDFNAGDEVHRPGYDGTTTVDHGNAWVPDGSCYWEMGVNAGVKGKLDDDYEKRIEGRGEGDFSQVSYRAVTPRNYQNKNTWSTEMEKLGQWRDVRVYDSSDLEQWLENAPGVALWLARQISQAPPEGILDLSTHWQNTRDSLKRPLPPDVLLISREQVLERFRAWTEGEPKVLREFAPNKTPGFLAGSSMVKLVDARGCQRQDL